VNPEELVSQALAELEAESQSALSDVRTRAGDARSRIEATFLELRAQAGSSVSVEASEGVWELEPDFDSSPEAEQAADLIAPVASDFTQFEGTASWQPDEPGESTA